MAVKETYRAPDGKYFNRLKLNEVGEYVTYNDEIIIDCQPCKLIGWDEAKQKYRLQLGNIYSDRFAHVTSWNFPIQKIESPIGDITIVFKSLINRI